MTTTDGPRQSPGKADAQARANCRARLRKFAAEAEALSNAVSMRLEDRSGNYRWGWLAPPSDDSDLRSPSPSRPRFLDRWDRIKREAAEGCAESATFVALWEPTVLLTLHLRHERPPGRAPDYDPKEGLIKLTADQRAFLAEGLHLLADEVDD